MSGQTALQSDLLARGMSKTTRILGVPFSYALGNIGLFVFVMMVGYAASGSFMAFVIALGGMSLWLKLQEWGKCELCPPFMSLI